MKNLIKDVFTAIKTIVNSLVGFVKKTFIVTKKTASKWSGKKITKIIAFIVGIIVSIKIFMLFVLTFLLAADPLHFAKIVEMIVNINIFEIISYRDFYLMLFGGFVMDMVVLTLVLWLTLWAGWNKQYLKKDWFKLLGLWCFGLLFFLAGLYYALPEIVEAANDCCIYYDQNHYQDLYEWKGDWRGVPETIIMPEQLFLENDWWY